MNVETVVDPNRADQLASDLRAVAGAAEPALEPDELETLDAAAAFIEDAGCIERGERLMESPATETTYRVTRWIDMGDGQVVALSKEEVDPAQLEDD